MRNILRNIRIAFGSKSAISALANETIANDARLDKIQRTKEDVVRSKQYTEPVQREVVVGHLTTDDITSFSSDYARSAIAQLGCWSAIARGFTEFVKNPKSETADALCLEFHAWNAASPENKQMDDTATLETIAKLSQVAPPKGNKDTDAVIARVLKKSVEEVRADREAKAALRTKQREEQVLNFNSLLWSTTYSDGEYSMPAQKALDKLEQTLLWMAGWDTTNPAALAAELLLVESDINLVRSIAKKAAGATEDFEEGVMAADTLTRKTA